MNKLLKQYGMNSDMQYFEMIAESFLNGQNSQARTQFKAMPKRYRISFMKSANSHWNSGIDTDKLNTLYDLI